jgi:HD superfamily phosphohydrolase
MRFHDKYHGYIELCHIAISIVDTPIFQRLRNIKQTGVLYLVFPTASHSRFEHSIGTYHLANEMISKIKNKQPELGITDEIIMLVSIAGLCHDLGHLLFSHLFDDYFVSKITNIEINLTHEDRSIFLLNHIVNKYKINLNNAQLKVIGDLIVPKNAEYSKWNTKYKIGKWIFQIISNPINSIDVDKFDYLIRDTDALGFKLSFDYNRIINDAKVINDKICYSTQCSNDIYYMFFIRYRLHRQIYNHKAVKAIEILIIKLLFELESKLKISEYLLDVDKMIKLVDPFILLSDSDIMNDIYERKLPKMVYQDITITPSTFDDTKLKKNFNENSYEIMKFKVGYVSSKNNPLNNITFYNLKTGTLINENKFKNFSLLINHKHQEYFLRVYCKDLSLLDKFKTFFNNKTNSNDTSKNDNSIDLDYLD